MNAAMINAVRATNPEPGPLPKIIGKGPMKTAPPNDVEEEAEPTLPRTTITIPVRIRRKPSA